MTLRYHCIQLFQPQVTIDHKLSAALEVNRYWAPMSAELRPTKFGMKHAKHLIQV